MSFETDIDAFKKDLEDAADKIFRGSALEVLGAVVLRTPVDTGRLRGNWQTSLNTPLNGELDNLSVPRVRTALRKATVKDVIYMVNNLPYAAIIEQGAKNRAPVGMVRLTILDWERAVRANTAKHKI